MTPDHQHDADAITEREGLASDAGPLNIYMPATYRARAEYLAEKLDLRDNRGHASISLLLRRLIDEALVQHG